MHRLILAVTQWSSLSPTGLLVTVILIWPAPLAAQPVARPESKQEKRLKEVLGKAVRAVDNIPDEERKAFALMVIATAQARAGDRQAAITTFARAEETGKAIHHNDKRQHEMRKGTTLMYLAKAEAEAGEIEAAGQTANAAEVEAINSKDWAWAVIAGCQAKAGDLQGALTTVDSLPDSGKPLALMQVTLHLAEAGNIKKALTLAEKIQEDSYRVDVLTQIAVHQARLGDREGAMKVIASARQVVDVMKHDGPNPNTSPKTWSLALVALALVRSGDNAAGLKIAEELKGSHHRDKILAEVANRQVEVGKVKEALQTLEDIQDGIQRALVLKAIAVAQARARDLKAALKTIEPIEHVGEKSQAFLELATVQAKAGKHEEAEDLYRGAIISLKDLDILWYEVGEMCATPQDLHAIAKAWAEGGGSDGALAWANVQASPFVRAVALAGIAEGMAQPGHRKKR